MPAVISLKATVSRQSGMALILLLFVLGLAAMAFMLHALNVNGMKVASDNKTQAALVEAKAALIGRAAADDNRPGSLPCPDGNGDGSADLFAGVNCPVYIGRFPWKTLGTARLADGAGEGLWYALSSNYRDHAAAEPVNGTAPGSLRVDGTNDVVAIIFSPGAPMAAQTGRPSNTVSDYLEGENADGDADFSRQPSGVQNDRLIPVSRAELLATVYQRVLRTVGGDATQGMNKYYAGAAVYPYADFDGDGHADIGLFVGNPSYQGGVDSLSFNGASLSLLQNNGWFFQVNYSVAADRKSAMLELHGKTLTLSP